MYIHLYLFSCIHTYIYRLNEVNDKIRHYETDDKTNTHRKEFSTLEKTYRTLRRDAEVYIHKYVYIYI
jgi:uncharacterized protein (UPF0297 family)